MAKTNESQKTWENVNVAFEFYYQKAVKAYDRYCSKNNFFFQYPSKGDSFIDEVKDKFFITLNNVNGQLARYEILPSNRLRKAFLK